MDNVFCTPALQRPLELGADLVIHSATKYLDGQGRVLGGAVAGAKELVSEPMLAVPAHRRARALALQRVGDAEGPGDAGAAHARAVGGGAGARALARRPSAVERVLYPGLESHPQHALAMRQQRAGGAVLSFVVKGGREARLARDRLDAADLASPPTSAT